MRGVPRALHRRSRGGDDARPHLRGDDVGKGRLAEPRGPVQQDVVERLPPLPGGLKADAEAADHPGLADALVQSRRPEAPDELLVVSAPAVAAHRRWGLSLLAETAGRGHAGTPRSAR